MLVNEGFSLPAPKNPNHSRMISLFINWATISSSLVDIFTMVLLEIIHGNNFSAAIFNMVGLDGTKIARRQWLQTCENKPQQDQMLGRTTGKKSWVHPHFTDIFKYYNQSQHSSNPQLGRLDTACEA